VRATTLVATGLIMLGCALPASASATATGGATSDGAPASTVPAPGPPAAVDPAPTDPAPVDPAPSPGAAGFGVAPAPAPQPTVPGTRGVIKKGVAYAPAAAPIEVQRAIWSANQLRTKPYVWGGGHAAFRASGYDCSGTVSYALHGAGLIDTPMDSNDFMSWGVNGKGQWITVYTNPDHAFAIIAGLRLDTSGPGESGPRWRTAKPSTRGFSARHPRYF
jgi:cell wall-associated NlpC family hydrolase